jgi:hypothetical protein
MGYAISHKEAIKKTAEIVGFETPLSRFSSFFGREFLDVDKFARGLEKLFPGFDFDNREYEGMSISLNEFILLKFGKEDTEIIKQALMVDDLNKEELIKMAAANTVSKLMGKGGLIVIVGGDDTNVEKWLRLTHEFDTIMGFDLPIDEQKTIKENQPRVNIAMLGKKLEEKDREFEYGDVAMHRYLGVKVSMKDYVEIRYGKRAVELILFFNGQKTLEQVYKK